MSSSKHVTCPQGCCPLTWHTGINYQGQERVPKKTAISIQRGAYGSVIYVKKCTTSNTSSLTMWRHCTFRTLNLSVLTVRKRRIPGQTFELTSVPITERNTRCSSSVTPSEIRILVQSSERLRHASIKAATLKCVSVNNYIYVLPINLKVKT